MNLVYIHTHDSGRYFEPYGYNIPTPNIMELARSGTMFRNAYCASPTCSPSRSAMLTGRMPHNNGMMGLAHRGFGLNDYKQHMSNYLKANGFYTVLCGMQHEAHNANDIGYDEVRIDPRNNNEDPTGWDMANAGSAIDFLRNRSKDKPFFLSYGLFHTHRPFLEIDPGVNPDHVLPPAVIPDNAETRTDMAGYITSAKRADTCIGLLLKELKKQNLLEDTLVLFTTDHGLAFPYMKCNLYDTGTGVTLIMGYPGNPSKGRVKDTLVSHLDVFPTVCDILKLEKPAWLQGESLLPVLENRREEIRDEVYSEVTFHASYEPMRAVRTKRYKYIRVYQDKPAPANIDNSVTKDFFIEEGFLDRTVSKEMLFDLYFDPCERTNLAGYSEYSKIYGEMKSKLDSFMEETNDPMTAGFMKREAHAFVNKLTCVNPDSKDPDDYEFNITPIL